MFAISCNKATVDVEVYDKDDLEPILESTNTIQYLSTDLEYNTLLDESEMVNVFNYDGYLGINIERNSNPELDTIADLNELRGHWKMNSIPIEGGVLLSDSSGNGNSAAVISDDPTTNKSSGVGLGGSSMVFNGTGDYLSVPTDPSLEFSSKQEITIMAWVKAKPEAFESDTGIVCKGDDDWLANSYILALEDGMGFSFRVKTCNGNARLDSGVAKVNEWIFVVGVYNGSTLKLYQDGVEVGSMAYSGDIISNSDNVSIGKRCGVSDNRFFKGELDDVAIFGRALSANEIEDIYNASKGYYDLENESDLISPVMEVSGTLAGFTPNHAGIYGKPFMVNSTEQALFGDKGIDSTGLISLWAFDEESISDGLSASDSVASNSNNGVYIDSGLDGEKIGDGKFLNSLYFDGINDAFKIPLQSSLNIVTDQVSMAAWIYPTASGQSAASRIISRSDTGSSDSYALRFESDNKVSCRFKIGNSTKTIYGRFPIEINKWSFVACSYDGSNVRVYINGVLSTISTAINGNVDDYGTDVYIGTHEHSPGSRRFEGYIDEVSLWSRPLEKEEVLALYERGQTSVDYQIRFCEQDDCSDGVFVGPGSDPNKYFNEKANKSANISDHDLTGFNQKKFIQYRAILRSENDNYSPMIQGVSFH